ncbi:efflux transporter outer membrane subunit [Burkholderia ubonensis]|uniref:efflux transporter outer membrane subunit n=1 Tax=Burkholderia ubonensis TaxID=101571 RepID=UPI000A11F3AD|nr:efflux transporter outer membrane subunit [Burkholderia ubonensis]
MKHVSGGAAPDAVRPTTQGREWCAVPARRAAAALLCASLAACSVGPDYRRPDVSTPQAWRIDQAYSYWHPAEPAHASLDDTWWRAFGIAELDALEQRALEHNQTLREAVAHYDQAKATFEAAWSTQLPEVGVGFDAARRRISANRPLTDYGSPNASTVQNDFRAGVSASWEIDLFGRIRRAVEAAKAGAQQSADDLANARLALTAQVASAYFELRTIDDERGVLERSIEWQQKGLDFVNAQERFGQVSHLSVLQQRAQLDATRVQLRLLLARRAQFEHAIATLIGEPAPQFALAPNRDPYTLPMLPIGLPSELLLRRPDVASAEREMAAANARIGLARAAYFPSLTLSPTLGWDSTRFASLFSVPSLVWSVGGAIGETLFDGGKRAAGVAYAQAGYSAAKARYRQTVLTAFQEMQDAVDSLAVLDAARGDAQTAVADSRRLLALATYRYEYGSVDYLDVISAQQQLLASEREDARIRGQQARTVVFMAKALGGGWRDAASASAQQEPAQQASMR